MKEERYCNIKYNRLYVEGKLTEIDQLKQQRKDLIRKVNSGQVFSQFADFMQSGTREQLFFQELVARNLDSHHHKQLMFIQGRTAR